MVFVDRRDAGRRLAEDGTAVLDTRTARRVGMTQRLLDATIDREVRELRRRVATGS